MLYLLTPPYQLLWTPQPESWIELAKEHGTDLGQIDWAPAEEPHSPGIVVRLALRYGTECSRGIVFPAWTLSQAEKPVKLAALTGQLRESSARIAESNDPLMEAVIPGWTKYNAEEDRELDASMKESIARAQEDADELLSAPELPHLVSTWKRMGGIAPTHAG